MSKGTSNLNNSVTAVKNEELIQLILESQLWCSGDFFSELIWEKLRSKMSSLEMRTLIIPSRIQKCWKLGFRRYPPLLCCWDPLRHLWQTSFQCIKRNHQHWIFWSSWFAKPGSDLGSQPYVLPLLLGFPRDTIQSRLIDLEAIFCSLMTWLSQKSSHQCLSLHWQNPEGNLKKY